LIERKVTISAIARQMGIDRKTVRNALKEPLPAGQPPSAPSVLDPYKDYLRGRLEVADFTAQRLYQDIQAQGYRASYNLVKRFVAPLRADRHRQAVIRFETQPGQQAQVDWSAFGILAVDGVRKALSCFSMILGFSRYQYIEFSLSRNLASFLSCHVHAFEYFGGCAGGTSLRQPQDGGPEPRGRDGGVAVELYRLRLLLRVYTESLPTISASDQGQGRKAFSLHPK
jgi:transposase